MRDRTHTSTATSADIVDTARILSFKDVANHVLIPTLKQLLTTLITLLRREVHTVQIGRTHGQHAVPLTFGLVIAGYVSRLGSCITNLHTLTKELRRQCSGAVGAHNAASLLVADPEEFEREVLVELGLEPAEHSTQVISLEAIIRFFSQIVLTMGVLANIADDLRHLGRTEIGEVGEYFGDTQVGSSTMPQKKNPISFENVKSMWKIITPRLTTLFMDQISEYQRDLTSSTSARTYGEIIAYAVTATKRLTTALSKLSVDQHRMSENLAYEQDLITAEPLYIILSTLGHQDAHEKVGTLSREARKQKCSLQKIAEQDSELAPYRARMSPRHLSVLRNPQKYIGSSAHKALAIALRWEKELNLG